MEYKGQVKSTGNLSVKNLNTSPPGYFHYLIMCEKVSWLIETTWNGLRMSLQRIKGVIRNFF